MASQSYDLGPGPGIGWPGVRDVAGVNPLGLAADCLFGSSGYPELSCRCDMIAVRFGHTACGGSDPAPRGPYALFAARRGGTPRRLKRVDATALSACGEHVARRRDKAPYTKDLDKSSRKFSSGALSTESDKRKFINNRDYCLDIIQI